MSPRGNELLPSYEFGRGVYIRRDPWKKIAINSGRDLLNRERERCRRDPRMVYRSLGCKVLIGARPRLVEISGR